jgi:hypothetical protein
MPECSEWIWTLLPRNDYEDILSKFSDGKAGYFNRNPMIVKGA